MVPASSTPSNLKRSSDSANLDLPFYKARKKKMKEDRKEAQEAIRLRFQPILEEFRKSNDEVYTIEARLTNSERGQVHELWREMGMKSKSSGVGDARRISLYKVKVKVKNKNKNKNKTKTKTKTKTETETKTKIKNMTKTKIMTCSKTETKSINTEAKSPITSFRFSEEGKTVLRDFFSLYPPGGEAENTVVTSSKITDKIPVKTDDIFCKPRKRNKSWYVDHVSRLQSDPKLKQITEARSKLPIASFKHFITSTVESNQVVLISGETGCGKTTQVPQYLLDHMWMNGKACKIVCTQPRRISAISVADRIATERGELIGENVGYKIRLEKKGGRDSSIVFCTNGVLLRVLVRACNGTAGKKKSAKTVEDSFSNITHIIVDEIHERDRFSDFLLTIIRDVLPLYPHLHVVLMSATLDAERFSQYFGGCPIIRVPGFTYDVKKLYLEDVLMLLKSKSTQVCHLDSTAKTNIAESSELTRDYKLALDEAIDLAWSSDELDSLSDLVSMGGARVCNYQHSVTGVTPLMVFARKGRVGDMCLLLSSGANCHLQDNEGKTALPWVQHADQNDASEVLRKELHATALDPNEEKVLLDRYLKDVNPELVDVFLIEELLRKICTESEEGAILVFLPGWDEINKLQNKLSSSDFFNDSFRFLIVGLHSMVPSIEQKKVFTRPPYGCRKIILSTNIAETSITIDDVVFVIDSGRVKERNYDPHSEVSTLHSYWISKANAKQREGRAGRCQPGICYHLYSKLRAASLMEFQVPEIMRTPIEELCLQVKLLDPSGKIEDFLEKTLDPPGSMAIRNAITILQDLGALSPDEELTELGEKLGSIPAHPSTSKMLLFASSVNCLDPALTLACASGYRDPFTLQMSPAGKKAAAAAKSELASLYGGHGDQLAVIAAFECWKKAKQQGAATESNFCYRYFLSGGVMQMLSGMRKQLERELLANGFIPENSSKLNENSKEVGVIHALLVAGLYPRVGRLLPPDKNSRTSVIENANNCNVRLQQQSAICRLNFKEKDTSLVTYDEITRGDSGLSVKNCSIIGPLPLLLLAAEIAVAPINHDDGSKDDNGTVMSDPNNAVKVVADRWLSFESTALDAAYICCLREQLSAAILFKIKHPGKALPKVLAASIKAITKVFLCDGLSGITAPIGWLS